MGIPDPSYMQSVQTMAGVFYYEFESTLFHGDYSTVICVNVVHHI